MYIIKRTLVFCFSFQMLILSKICEGKRVKLPRYVVETDLKPAIFGSYSYDMINGQFILNNDNSSTTEINLTDIIFNNTSPSTIIDESYRKHDGITATQTIKSFNWWPKTRELLKNSTFYKHYMNKNETFTTRAKIKSEVKNTSIKI